MRGARPHFALALALFVLLQGPPAAADQGWQEIPIPDWCPPSTHAPKGDINNDKYDDYLLHTQTDAQGRKIELWCIGEGLYGFPGFAVVVTGPDGVPRMVGRDAYNQVYFWAHKLHDDQGRLLDIHVENWDPVQDDSDGDGKRDGVMYDFNTTTGNLTVTHYEGRSAQSNNSSAAPRMESNASSLDPHYPFSDDFWNHAPQSGNWRAPRYPRMWTFTAFEVRATRGNAVAARVPVHIFDGAEQVANATTDAAGSAWFSLEGGKAYAVEVQGAPQFNVTLSEPTVRTVAVPAPTPGASAVASLAALITVAAGAAVARRAKGGG